MGELFSGRGELKKITVVVRKTGAKQVFLVTGKNFYVDAGIDKAIVDLIPGVKLDRFVDFEPNPQYRDLLRGIDKMTQFRPDLIIGIGGGSVLDMAKLLSLFSSFEGDPFEVIAGLKPAPERVIPLALVPTTAGSGSESTHFAVVYADGKKYSIADPAVLPDYVILDPDLLKSVPRSLAAITAFDALAQAIESYWAVSSSEESRTYASESISIIKNVYNKLLDDPDSETREQMMRAAHLSGKAINLTKTTAPHALSYGFTVRYGMPHGQALMLTLPGFFLHNAAYSEGQLRPGLSAREHNERMLEICHLLGTSTAQEAIGVLKDMALRANLRFDFGKAERRKETEKLAVGINLERLNNNPVFVTKEQLREIIDQAFNFGENELSRPKNLNAKC